MGAYPQILWNFTSGIPLGLGIILLCNCSLLVLRCLRETALLPMIPVS